MQSETQEILKAFNDTANDLRADLKADIEGVKDGVTRINAILVGAGNGGLISDIKDLKQTIGIELTKVDKKIDKLELDFEKAIAKRDKLIEKANEEREKIKQKIWTWGGAIAVLIVLANFLLPKLIG